MSVKESVHHPEHYNPNQIECIDYIESLGHGEGFCIGNVIKYVARYNQKGGVEDLRKAAWYLNRAIGLLEKGDV